MGGSLAPPAVAIGSDRLLILVFIEARTTDSLRALITVHNVLQEIGIDFRYISKESLCGIIALKGSTATSCKRIS